MVVSNTTLFHCVGAVIYIGRPTQGSMGRDEQWDYMYIAVDGTSGRPWDPKVPWDGMNSGTTFI